jgi:hypothetical protein
MSIKLWRMNNGLQLVSTKNLETNIYILLKINEEFIAAGGYDGKIRLLSSVNLDCSDMFDAHKGSIFKLIKLDE